MDKWFNVNKDIRVWAGHSEVQKQGWIFAPAAVFAVEEYKGAIRFKPEDMLFDGGGRVELKEDPRWPEYWARLDDLSLEPFNPDAPEDPGPVGPDPVPAPVPSDEPSDAEVGRVVKFLLRLL